jgi:hypothetical protein
MIGATAYLHHMIETGWRGGVRGIEFGVVG